MKTKNKDEQKGNRQHMEFLYGKKNADNPFYQTVFHVHQETVRHCDHCGKPMTRSEVNDYGSLCEKCYMKEYY